MNGQKNRFYLKIVQQKDIKSYQQELLCLEAIMKEKLQGFPKLISAKEGPDHSEMLLEGLGPNLRQLITEYKLSKATSIKITLQLLDLIE
jgi:hypothetical protein